jgi:hypothetical protein
MGVIQETLVRELITPLQAALDALANVPDESQVMLDPGTLPACLELPEQPSVEIDGGDLQGVRSALALGEGMLRLFAAYDVDFDVAAELEKEDGTLAEVLQSNPNMLLLRASGGSELAQARSSFDSALESFIGAIDQIADEEDDQSDDFLVIDPFDQDVVARARETAQDFRVALQDETTLATGTLDLPSPLRVRLGPLFDGDVESLRSVIPPAGTDMFECSLSDPTVAGIFPDVTQDFVNEIFELDCP